MPYDEDKQDLGKFADHTAQLADENPTKDKTLIWSCLQCEKDFKMGLASDKDDNKERPLNPDSSDPSWQSPALE